MIQLTDKVIVYEVPEGVPVVIEDDILKVGELKNVTYLLPPGTWRYICTSKGITNEQTEQIVERDGDGFKDYSKDNFHPDIPFEWAPNSLDSLLASKGLDVNKNYCLIEKM